MRFSRFFTSDWAVPPGDDGSVLRATRRRTRRTALAGGGAFLMVVTSLGYPLLNTSTEVRAEDVLAEFRAARASGGSGAAISDTGPPKEKRSSEPRRGKVAKGDLDPASPSRRRTTTVAAPTNRQRGSLGAGGGGQRDADPERERVTAQREEDDGRPREGVYTWSIEGYERAPGIQRQLPQEGHRVITHSSQPNRWVEHLIFSEQKEMWFDLSVTNEGVFSNSSRNKVRIGPMTEDRTVTFNPPLRVSKWPFEVGTTWRGSWMGKTYGNYTAKTFEHTFIEVEGERVEVWAAEVRMQLQGDVEGTVVTRSWVAPDYNMVVKQYQETSVRSGPGSYYSEWEGQVRSVEPQT